MIGRLIIVLGGEQLANSATTVFPVPTSPISSRACAARRHITADLADRLTLIAGELERKILAELRGDSRFSWKVMPRPGPLRQMRARACTSC